MSWSRTGAQFSSPIIRAFNVWCIFEPTRVELEANESRFELIILSMLLLDFLVGLLLWILTEICLIKFFLPVSLLKELWPDEMLLRSSGFWSCSVGEARFIETAAAAATAAVFTLFVLDDLYFCMLFDCFEEFLYK